MFFKNLCWLRVDLLLIALGFPIPTPEAVKIAFKNCHKFPTEEAIEHEVHRRVDFDKKNVDGTGPGACAGTVLVVEDFLFGDDVEDGSCTFTRSSSNSSR